MHLSAPATRAFMQELKMVDRYISNTLPMLIKAIATKTRKQGFYFATKESTFPRMELSAKRR